MKTARVRCVVCNRTESIAYDDSGVTGRSQVQAFAQAAEAAGWMIKSATVDGEILARDRCPEHRLAPVIAEVVGAPV